MFPFILIQLNHTILRMSQISAGTSGNSWV